MTSPGVASSSVPSPMTMCTVPCRWSWRWGASRSSVPAISNSARSHARWRWTCSSPAGFWNAERALRWWTGQLSYVVAERLGLTKGREIAEVIAGNEPLSVAAIEASGVKTAWLPEDGARKIEGRIVRFGGPRPAGRRSLPSRPGRRPMSSEHWMDRPEDHDFPAALSYLTLLMDSVAAGRVVEALKNSAATDTHKAKDILRASGLPLLPKDNAHVKSDLSKVGEGKKRISNPLNQISQSEPSIASASAAMSSSPVGGGRIRPRDRDTPVRYGDLQPEALAGSASPPSHSCAVLAPWCRPTKCPRVAGRPDEGSWQYW